MLLDCEGWLSVRPGECFPPNALEIDLSARATRFKSAAMKKNPLVRVGILSGVLLILLPLTAVAQGSFGSGENLAHDGSFESASFGPPGPWRWSGCLEWVINEPQRAAEGSNFVVVCGLIYQDIATVPGLPYELRFAFGGNEQEQQNLEPLHVRWGNQEIAAIPVTPVPHQSPQWRYLSFGVVAVNSTMRLGFTSYPGQASPYIDEVSVVAVPEPSVFSLLAFITASRFGISLFRLIVSPRGRRALEFNEKSG
ncbi:MAG: hypothetical protein ACYDH9_16045 [Limisphaerales bacterium]